MSQPMINNPIAAMQSEASKSNLFEGLILTSVDGGPNIYHIPCDEDIITMEEDDDKEFSEVLDAVLKHLAECDVDEDEDDDDIEEIDFEDEE